MNETVLNEDDSLAKSYIKAEIDDKLMKKRKEEENMIKITIRQDESKLDEESSEYDESDWKKVSFGVIFYVYKRLSYIK